MGMTLRNDASTNISLTCQCYCRVECICALPLHNTMVDVCGIAGQALLCAPARLPSDASPNIGLIHQYFNRGTH